MELAKKRLEARNNRDFKLADRLRDEINDLGYIVEDAGDDFKIKKKA